jgi:endonuclease IV
MKRIQSNPNFKFGTSFSKDDAPKGFLSLLHHLRQNPCLQSYQLFLTKDDGINIVTVSDEEIVKVREHFESTKTYGCVHSCLRYNLAGSTDLSRDPKLKSKKKFVISGLSTELDISTGFGLPVVVHLGVCKYTKQGMKCVSQNIVTCLTGVSPQTSRIAKLLKISQKELKTKRYLLLENSAGEGNDLGMSFVDIAEIIKEIPLEYHSQIGVLIDTCHIFASGEYNLSKVDEVERLFKDASLTLPKNVRIECIHLNDSKKEFGCHVDRHACLGKGHIWDTDESHIAFLRL